MGWIFERFFAATGSFVKKKREKNVLLSLLNISTFVEKAIEILYHLKACFFVIKMI